MKKLFLFIVVLCLLSNCNARKKTLVHYLSTLENVKFIVSKEDSIKIDSVKLSLQKTQEKIDREKNGGWICFESEDRAQFKGGITLFRKLIFEKFKISTESKEGENLIRITIGKDNNLEMVKLLKYSDENTKKQIEDIFKSKEFDNWSSARLYRIPVKQQFEISIFIKKR
ncbi:hypothetical protein [Chryseobacterium indoltheticum]|uniref:Lipoprotein n=1 Tax=Chryseobacterium indoltheticum TaxID=254 RepID=A0A381JSU6_9FLAO|nr:hypothetical protein [Chryseobacterium indoltheticum]AZA75648.1 hypothetical protein EG358_18730 [Chryseobacterium indoltheticum]SIQ46128.1 hypothetical protein SAMN05421682_105107 [Chryseobacterium indoltheticum]SUY53778.1 Uncharacterised protein [Chryseobacterium indoltheticum]